MAGRTFRLPFTSGALPSGAAMLALRVVMGSLLALHGYRKLDAGVGKFVATVARDGFPFPEVLARATIFLEFAGGLCILIGLLTRLWGALVTTEMLMIVAHLKWDRGPLGAPGQGGGFELDLLYAVIGLALLVAGPGLAAADRWLGLEADMAPEAAPVRAEHR